MTTRLRFLAVRLILALLTLVSVGPVRAEEERDGKQLAEELRNLQPVDTSLNGAVKVKRGRSRFDVPFDYKTSSDGDRWEVIFSSKPTERLGAEMLKVVHRTNRSNEYFYARSLGPKEALPEPAKLRPDQLQTPFADSDFWLSDLGLEFLHWADQQKLNGEMRLGRPCYVIESRDPKGVRVTRVKTWIDKETGGPLVAEFYNARNEMIKEFSISGSSFKKINGKYQLEKMEMAAPPSNSETVLKFDLSPEIPAAK